MVRHVFRWKNTIKTPPGKKRLLRDYTRSHIFVQWLLRQLCPLPMWCLTDIMTFVLIVLFWCSISKLRQVQKVELGHGYFQHLLQSQLRLFISFISCSRARVQPAEHEPASFTNLNVKYDALNPHFVLVTAKKRKKKKKKRDLRVCFLRAVRESETPRC